jgi:hypothetical protein
MFLRNKSDANQGNVETYKSKKKCMNDDVELYGLKAESNQFKTLRRRITRQVDDSIL